jgi:hypothetical protein
LTYFMRAVQVRNLIGDRGAGRIAEGLKVSDRLRVFCLVRFFVLCAKDTAIVEGDIGFAHASAAARKPSWKRWR